MQLSAQRLVVEGSHNLVSAVTAGQTLEAITRRPVLTLLWILRSFQRKLVWVGSDRTSCTQRKISLATDVRLQCTNGRTVAGTASILIARIIKHTWPTVRNSPLFPANNQLTSSVATAGAQTFTGSSVGGACPSTHPIHIPQIMLEVHSPSYIIIF